MLGDNNRNFFLFQKTLTVFFEFLDINRINYFDVFNSASLNNFLNFEPYQTRMGLMAGHGRSAVFHYDYQRI